MLRSTCGLAGKRRRIRTCLNGTCRRIRGVYPSATGATRWSHQEAASLHNASSRGGPDLSERLFENLEQARRAFRGVKIFPASPSARVDTNVDRRVAGPCFDASALQGFDVARPGRAGLRAKASRREKTTSHRACSHSAVSRAAIRPARAKRRTQTVAVRRLQGESNPSSLRSRRPEL